MGPVRRGVIAIGVAALLFAVVPIAGAQPFGDDFESGNLRAWDRVSGTPQVTTATSHHGRFSLKLPRTRAGHLITHAYRRPARRASLGFSYRRQRAGWIELMRLDRNRLRLADNGRGRLVIRHGRRVISLGRVKRAGNWNRVTIQFDARRDRVRVFRNGSRTARWIRVPRLKAETRVSFGARPARNGPLYLDSINRLPARPAAPTTPATPPAPTPAPPPALAPAPRPAPPPPDPAPEPAADGLFAADSIWNARLDPAAPLHPNSARLVDELVRQVDVYGPWINTTAYSTPLVIADADTPTQRVRLTATWGPNLQAAWQNVPIPPDTVAASGTDSHLTIWQPSTDTLWEFWRAERVGGVWQARWGARIDDVSRSPGIVAPVAGEYWGATATSLPAIAGTVLIDEFVSGSIGHALALAIPKSKADEFVWPALRTDGEGLSSVPLADQIPEGAHFRLPSDFDMSRLAGAHPVVRMLAVAARDHGIILRDKAGAVTFYAEDPVTRDDDPYAGIFGGAEIWQVAREFPWGDLQVLQPRQ